MNKKTPPSLAGRQLVDLIAWAAQEKLAENITCIDVSGMATTTDFFVICQSDTTVQNRAIANAILDSCRENGTRPWHCEGKEEGRWVLIDFTDVVVHLLLPDLRSYYDLESLWPEGKKCTIRQQ
ncbi:MAG: ribosome silencing factor [Chitinispirillaceae bacterium]|nr:ribosome silencing factor [Chitinispirillaceae bacterium]